MKRYIIKRLIASLLTLFCIVTLVFFLVRLLPGDPFTTEDGISEEAKKNILEYYGMDKPLLTQYFYYLKNLLKGDLGYSLNYGNWSVNDIIAQGFPYSMELGLKSVAVGTILGVILGIIASLNRGKFLDYFSIFIAVIGVSVPNFVFASLLQYFFAIKLKIFPISGWNGFMATVLPIASLGLFSVANRTRMMRTCMLEEMNKDYIKTARAKGLRSSEIVIKHQIRNAIMPTVTTLGPAIASAMVGSFVIESIYSIPGIGKFYVQGIQTLDYSLVLGLSLFYSVFLIVCNFIVDIAYGFIDPRIKVYSK